MVVSLDADFLAAHGSNLGPAKGWGERRTPDENMSRLYAIGPEMTVTASVADHRLRTRGSEIEGIARGLAARLAGSKSSLSPLGTGAPSFDAAKTRFLDAVAKDLLSAAGQALVVVGDRQAPVVHALAHAINAELGAIGQTVTLVKAVIDDVNTGAAAIKTLTDELNNGQVDALVVTAWNPAYARYADIDFGAALKKFSDATSSASEPDSKVSIVWSMYEDETSALGQWFVPASHPLETWGDARALDGSVLLQQPLLEPLYAETMTEAQLFSAFLGEADKPTLSTLKESWKKRLGEGIAFETTWDGWLRAGTVSSSAFAAEAAPVVDFAGIGQSAAGRPVDGYELALRRDNKLHDGRYANSVWLLELPDPMTKLVWDNAAIISPATARKLGLKDINTGEATWSHNYPMVSLTVKDKTVKAPVYVLPGCADDVITLPLGWGRTGTGEKSGKEIGVDAYALRYSDGASFTSVRVEPSSDTYKLVTTQEHWEMHGREIALEETLDKVPELEERLEHLNGIPPTLQQPVDYSTQEYKWGMATDLGRCTGCSACITACQAENNIPVVGKESVWRNREMFWIRVDRYFMGNENEPGIITQPLACQQCETAPCEYVCPVNATSHSDEGLNDMVYNRCIGTRYCSNNCPYKVRRFNYFHYNGEISAVERLGKNPDVTVRARGVMEKCTFCIQRIERARIEHRREDKKITDGAIKTACQQACPTDAISFGNLNDPTSVVAQKHADARRYNLLHDLGTRPRNAYLVPESRTRTPSWQTHEH